MLSLIAAVRAQYDDDIDYEDTTVETEEFNETTTEYENNTNPNLLRDFNLKSFDLYLNNFRNDNPDEIFKTSMNYPEPYPFPDYVEWE